MNIQEILKGTDKKLIKSLFLFDKTNTAEEILLKFSLWARYFFPQYFTSKDAPFHREMDLCNLRTYQGNLTTFVNITFRGGSKTVRTKLFLAFCIANDEDKTKKYIKVLSADIDNCSQITTDIYNTLISTQGFYNLFEKTTKKREERMSSFTTSTGIKVKADTVGTDQRGSIQEEARPDLIWFEDFESRTTLRSAIKTKMIADNIEEARTGLAKGGSAIYTANYISEAGNVHQLINKKSTNKKVLIIPIIKDGVSQWDRYTLQDIENMKKDDEDFAGERLCIKPETKIKTNSGFKEIKSLKVGDLVYTHLNNLKPVLRVFRSKSEDLLDITVGKKTISITKNHPVLIKKNGKIIWVEAGKLEMLYPIQKIEKSKYKGVVLNIEVADDNSYLTETLTLHNCKPDAGKDIYFNRDMLDRMEILQPIKEIAGFKIFKEYNPAHRYAGGHDVAGGVQLDSSTSVFIDFDTIPAQVVGTFASNTILPEAFGDEIYSESNIFGGCLLGIENNKYDQTILKAKQLGAELYMTQPKAIKAQFNMPSTYGWNTNSLTKSQMMSALREAINSGLIALNDKDLIQEFKGYTRNDIIDNPPDVRLTTRHFDLLTAVAIAWQMKEWASCKKLQKYHSYAKKNFDIYD